VLEIQIAIIKGGSDAAILTWVGKSYLWYKHIKLCTERARPRMQSNLAPTTIFGILCKPSDGCTTLTSTSIIFSISSSASNTVFFSAKSHGTLEGLKNVFPMVPWVHPPSFVYKIFEQKAWIIAGWHTFYNLPYEEKIFFPVLEVADLILFIK